MSRKFQLQHVKRTKAKGRYYYYFRTGRTGPTGKEILARLPDIGDPGFGNAYASFLAGRSKRATAQGVLTVGEMIDLYQKSPHFRKLSDGSQRIYGIYLKQFRDMFPTAPAQEIKREWMTKLVDTKAETPGAANSLLRTISALYRWARKRGHVTADPTRDIEPLPVGEHAPWPESLLSDGLASDDQRVRLAVHLLYYTALRIGDATALRWNDVRDGAIHVTPQKTRKHKTHLVIPLHDSLQAELDRQERSLGTIIPGEKGKPIHQHTLRESIQTWAAERGHKVVPHGLRKNAVSALLEAGCSAAEAAAISGQSLRLVEHYAKHRSQTNLATAAIYKWNRRNDP